MTTLREKLDRLLKISSTLEWMSQQTRGLDMEEYRILEAERDELYERILNYAPHELEEE